MPQPASSNIAQGALALIQLRRKEREEQGLLSPSQENTKSFADMLKEGSNMNAAKRNAAGIAIDDQIKATKPKVQNSEFFLALSEKFKNINSNNDSLSDDESDTDWE